MVLFALDTNIAIRAVKQREPIIWQNIEIALDQGHLLCLSTIGLLELRVGVHGSANPEAAGKKRDKFLSLIGEVWSFDALDAEIGAKLRCELLGNGQMIGAFDLLIAAQALRRGATVVTNNIREFGRIPGLTWVDWTKA